MYTKTFFAAGALLSLAAAVPLQQQNKRDIVYETRTIEAVTTIDVTTTVWLEPGETPPAAQSHWGHKHTHTKHITHTTTVQAPAPSSPSAPPPESPAAPPSPSIPQAPTTSVYVPPTTPAAPPPAPSPTQSPPSGGSPSGQQFSGDATYYTPGLGSCGQTNTESDSIVALAQGMMTAAMTDGNPNHNPLCGKQISITYNGVTATATIVDTCPGCSGAGLDMTPSLFSKFAELGVGRLHGVEWSYM